MAVDNLNFAIEPGAGLALLGPNGSGKSTTIRTIVTLQKADSGRFLCTDWDTFEQPARLRDILGYVSQELALDKTLTGLETLRFQAGLRHLAWSSCQARALELLSKLDLESVKNQRVGTYSGGMKRRLDLACALISSPQLLVLDEPSAGLDIQGRELVWSLIRHFKANGGCLILASHDFQEVDALADQVLVMDKGQTKQHGPVSQLKANLAKAVVRLKTREFMDQAEMERIRQVLDHELGAPAGLAEDQDYFVLFHQDESFHKLQDRVYQAFEKAKVPLFSLQVQQPSLEDVYRFAIGGIHESVA